MLVRETLASVKICTRCFGRLPRPATCTTKRLFGCAQTQRRTSSPGTGDVGREINKSASSSRPQLQGRADNAFFDDVMAGGPRPPVQVDSVLRNGRGFQLSTGVEISCAVLVLNGEALLWRPNSKIDAKGVLSMDIASFGILDVSSNKPDMLILGTGTRNEFVNKEVREYLHSLGIQIDTMDTRNAASTFNVLAAEGRSVAVALLPA